VQAVQATPHADDRAPPGLDAKNAVCLSCMNLPSFAVEFSFGDGIHGGIRSILPADV
jgi:hypothetical protein